MSEIERDEFETIIKALTPEEIGIIMQNISDETLFAELHNRYSTMKNKFSEMLSIANN